MDKRTCSAILLASALAIAFQVFVLSPISPDMLLLPTSSIPSNSKLQEASKLGEGLLKKPEAIAVDKTGVLYTATRDGWITRLHRNGSLEKWRHIDSHHLLGVTATAAGDLVVCDAEKGLLKVREDSVTVLASHVNDSKIFSADDVIESADGTLYFSMATTKFEPHNWHLEVLEAKSHGQLAKYDSSSKETSILLDNLAFANGVALSADQDYLVVCETWKYRCLKYWLKQEKRGQTEVFIDNLPGGPDNINLAPDGSFWIAVLEVVPKRLAFVHKSRAIKHIIGRSSKLSKLVTGFYNKAMVVNVASDGKIIRSFDDPTGKVMSFVTSALEFENHLYLGTLNCDFIGKLPLTTP
ncbi:protein STRICTOSIDINE SYNTHASE-LIKE 5-like [Olea europaea var. sylvestris]|uniref:STRICTOSIDINE SYNTHASE-LIKE 4-like n=1 Tax=Olea europaea subsp. europaea TaxID=158383 RepID=A0A8S0UZ47_OLEEU|nr:protein STRICTOSIDINE SYNTHASE-LIKE 5-like [Olea europaea var. sylvestris]CAA3021888.1 STRICTOSIDINE SYNTHASE-LIKE 4-like [Olea europaea subsp. europaea]